MQTSSMDFDRVAEAVREVCRFVRPTRLRPEAFFVARSGVLTLAFSGYTEALIRFKAELEGAIPGISAENPGSRWPKTTLGALRDGETLDEEDVVRLREATSEGTTCLYRRGEPIPVGVLSLVELRDRAMERVGRVESIRLVGPLDSSPVAPPESCVGQRGALAMAAGGPCAICTGYPEDRVSGVPLSLRDRRTQSGDPCRNQDSVRGRLSQCGRIPRAGQVCLVERDGLSRHVAKPDAGLSGSRQRRHGMGGSMGTRPPARSGFRRLIPALRIRSGPTRRRTGCRGRWSGPGRVPRPGFRAEDERARDVWHRREPPRPPPVRSSCARAWHRWPRG